MSRKRATTDGVNGRDGAGELPPLPKGWCWTTVSEIGKVQLGRQRSPKNRSDKYPTKYLRAANITWEGLDLGDVLDMDFKPSELPTYRLHPGDILLSEASGSVDEVGKPAVWKGEIEDCCFQNTVIRFRPVEMPPDFPLLVFRHFARNKIFAKVAHGVGIHHLGADRFSKMPFPLPPLQEQARIAAKADELLTEFDAGMAILKRVRTTLKLYRASVLKAAVEGRLTEEWRAKHPDVEPGSALLERILTERRRRWEERELAKFDATSKPSARGRKDKYEVPGVGELEGLPNLPRGWLWTTFGTLLREPLRNGHSAKASPDGNGVRTLTLTAVTVGDFSEKNTKLTVANPNDVQHLWLEPGDILIERSNTAELVGTSRLYRGPIGYAIFPDLLVRARLSPLICEGYMEAVLQADWARSFFRSRAKGLAGSMPKIDQGTILRLPVPLPPADEQFEIASEVERKISIVYEIEAQVGTNLKRSARLRQSILKRAFEGRLTHQDPDDEPAERLLERIRKRHGWPAKVVTEPTSNGQDSSGEVLPLFRTIEEDR